MRSRRLIEVLQACFSDLARRQEEQGDRSAILFIPSRHTFLWTDSRLQQAIEVLKPKVLPATDKKTDFWNLYKTLADEHDKEFHQRYSTDLDTTLIFVCIVHFYRGDSD